MIALVEVIYLLSRGVPYFCFISGGSSISDIPLQPSLMTRHHLRVSTHFGCKGIKSWTVGFVDRFNRSRRCISTFRGCY